MHLALLLLLWNNAVTHLSSQITSHHRLFHSSIYAENVGNHMTYLMYAEDNEEAVANARQRLESFLSPCDGSDEKLKESMEVETISCDDGEIIERAGDGYVDRYCLTEREPQSNRSALLRRLSFLEHDCSCTVRCSNETEFFRFAGCRCPRDEAVPQESGCLDPDCVWKTDDSGKWKVSTTQGSPAAFASVTLEGGDGTASLYSPYYQQISIQCALEFAYRLNSAAHSSIVVSAEAFASTDGSRQESVRSVVFREEKDYYSRRPRLGRFEPGHFIKPTRLRIECRSENGTISSPETPLQPTMCEIGKIVWDEECTAGSGPLTTCELESRFCDLEDHMRCMDDVACDLAIDCPNGKDEEVCDDQPIGARCDFNDEHQFCKGWTMLTVEHSKPVREHLLLVRTPQANYGPIHESRPGGGGFLLYSTASNLNRSLTTRDTFFTSPFFQPIFNDDGKCRLRFYIIQTGIDVEWSLSVIHPLWVEGAIAQQISVEDEGKRIERSWHRISTNIGPQMFPFAIQIEANWMAASSAYGNAFVAVDDISLSAECFDKAGQLTQAGNWTSMVVDSCGYTGSETIRKGKCRTRGHRRGPYQYLITDDQLQIWTVPETLHYRLVACGAEGGSFPTEQVKNYGGCVTVDTNLTIGTKLQISIGQKGESHCDKRFSSTMKADVLGVLCDGQRRDSKFNASEIYGAGGGGATTVSIHSVYLLVAGGGGGAYPLDYIEGTPNNPAGGAAHSPHSSDLDPRRTRINAGDGLSVSSVLSPMWSCGRFPISGGVALPCGSGAGGGGGYYGGAAQVRNHGFGGTSWIGVSSASSSMVSGVHRGDGLLTIYACRLKCPPRSTCVFSDRKPADHMECLCEHGETVYSSGRCAESRVLSLVLQHKLATVALLFCISMGFFGIFRFLRRIHKRYPTAADQIKLVVMRADYNDVNIGEPYWNQIASLPCLPWDEIAIGRKIGTGAFGVVHEGRTKDGQAYAVKTISMNKSTSAEAQREFAFEALFMHKFNHPNIVRLHWIQWDPPRLRIVLEYMGGGDLRTYLREARPTQENFNPLGLRIFDLLNIALDVAKGCEELNRQKYIHRDLAARNCLLTEKGPNRVVKIGDFGMARDIYENNYYRKGGRAKLPVRWMPPEAFLDGLFTAKTDVWSFGVVLWEISSFGMLPYFGVDNFDVMGLVTSGGRLDPPNSVPYEMHDIMRSCWSTDAESRPSFTEIVSSLEMILQKNDIAALPIHYFAPTMSSAVTSPVGFAAPMPSPSVAETPSTAVSALSPCTPDTAEFGVSMSGVPYIPINSGALREIFEEKFTGGNSPDPGVDREQPRDFCDDTEADVKTTFLGARVPPTPPPRRPTTLPRLRNS
ncbi:hypothetical protein Q1695_002337 [Nippostrongylus brasiliensis]|nr:hypothetical protein Q1695_002337 [Nippostrongylus brasiliensis]